ncbi:MAG TPA: 2-C-methyl-D-erythritol 4-phosphate cytidylyltransferase [Atribacterota bacterium]|nr:2-C-methyl-D-erythritol 4-phosphate cytidylyltransferase [Atribacterota bacterium]HOR41607.1 2-C-methyl-D-erythritol 4-phosphate cytidylyltransferase [Atribacterota bacterium]
MKNFALIAAAGSGERLQSSHSKMLVQISGKPLLSYTIDKFEESEQINEIILVVRAQDLNKIEQEIIKKKNYQKIKNIVIGGLTRQESVYNGLMVIKENDGIVCIHDGARPLIQKWMIEKPLGMIDNYDGVILAMPAIETIKKVYLPEMTVEETVDRNKFWTIQTPQIFKLKKIKEYYQRAKKEKIEVTDDAAILEQYGGKVGILRGSEENIKVTTGVDILLAEVLINRYHYKP